ncbi:hypothetical protein ACFYTQ_30700 [Nocardia sp. NPDC004068]|uniref:hypothetical protein n=1 Tax=Nocardia sp. NPDC004068 TaxID=3364303 RepID=UPI0036C6D4DE
MKTRQFVTTVLAAGSLAISGLFAADPAPASAGTGACAGNFHVIREVNGFVEWGVTSQCTGDDWYPHQVTAQLETQVGGSWVPVLRRASPGSDQGKPVVVLQFHNDKCRTNTSNNYRMQAWISAGKHATSAISQPTSLPCGDVASE